jgi:hypothetical protein
VLVLDFLYDQQIEDGQDHDHDQGFRVLIVLVLRAVKTGPSG